MRLINPEEFAYDLNTVVNGYWLEEAHPDIFKWVTRKVSLLLQRTRPDLFPPVVVKKSIMQGIKPRLEAAGLSLCPLTDFDVKDAQAGTLFHYKSAAYLGRPAEHFLGLRLSSLVEWMIQLRANGDQSDLMRITYEVALTKLTQYEARMRAAAEAQRLELEKRLQLLAEHRSAEFKPIRIELSKDWVFQLFHTEAEYLAEGTRQRNCVHWFFWPKFLRSHTLVGGIRRANTPDVPYLSVELGVQNFMLVQAEFEGHVDAPQNEEPIPLFQAWIQANRETLKVLRDRVFEYKEMEMKCQELQARQGQGEVSFAVRLDPPTLE